MTQSLLQTESVSDVESMALLISGFRATGVVCAAAQLGLPDLVGDAGAEPHDLAGQVGCDADAIARLMRTLASLGVFAETGDGRYVHTRRSELLKRTSEPSLHGLACMTSMLDLFSWSHLMHSLKTGEPAFPRVFGTTIFEYMKGQPEVSAAFDRAMGGFTEVVADAVLDAYDFSRYSTIIDIGGGNGTFLKKVLARHPHVRGRIYDLDHVVTRAMAAVAGTVWADRLTGISGSFLEFVPPGADLYTIKIVLCDWRDDDVTRILGHVRQAIGRGRLLIVDGVLPPGNAPCFAKLSDMNMLVTTGSRERTESEFRTLLNAAGFRVLTVQPVHEWVGLVEAVAAH